MSDPAPDTWHPTPALPAPLCLRLGLRYVAGLRAAAGQRIEAERARAPFRSLTDVVQRCGLRDDEAQTLAHIGAFTAFGLTRRAALWQAAAVPREPLFQGVGSQVSGAGPDTRHPTPDTLPPMSLLDRTLADYQGTGMTVGPHVVRHLRDDLTRAGVLRASDLKRARNGSWVKIAGLVIVRQRPGTAKGMCFITLEDETGTANAAVRPDVFEAHRTVIHTAALLLIEGPLQKVDDVIHVLARRLCPLELPHHPVGLTGRGYRMRVTPGATSNAEDHNDVRPADALPKSHDFR